MNLSGSQTARRLSKCLKEFLEVLDGEYDPLPEDPNKEVTSIANNVVFLCRCLLVDLMKNTDLTGTGAVYLSIATGDFEAFHVLLKMEVDDLREKQPDMLAEFKGRIEKSIRDRNFGEKWESTLLEV